MIGHQLKKIFTHNICFGWEIRKLFFLYALLTKGKCVQFFTFFVTGDYYKHVVGQFLKNWYRAGNMFKKK